MDGHFQCATCSVQYSQKSAGFACVGKILIKSAANTYEVFTLFTQQFSQLLKSLGEMESFTTPDDITVPLKAKIPVTVKFTRNGNKLSTIKAI